MKAQPVRPARSNALKAREGKSKREIERKKNIHPKIIKMFIANDVRMASAKKLKHLFISCVPASRTGANDSHEIVWSFANSIVNIRLGLPKPSITEGKINRLEIDQKQR